jgi:hypothetical protein
MDGMSFPQPAFSPIDFDGPEFEGNFAMDGPEFYEDTYLDMVFDPDMFFMGLGQDIRDDVTFKADSEFEEFLDGKKKEEELKDEEKKEWAKKHEKELKKQRVKVVVTPDGGVKLVNENSPLPEIAASSEFRQFLSGARQEISGKEPKVAKWLSDNQARLEGLGIKVQVQGDNYTLENTRMKNAALDQKAFAGSSLGGPEFKTFLAGGAPSFEGNDLRIAGWLMKNMEALEKAGVSVHIGLGADGNPKGEFSLQNKRLSLVSDTQKKALRELVRETKRMLADAKSILLKAKALKAGNPAEAKRLSEQGLKKLQDAQFRQSVISRSISLSRALHAERNAVKRLPPAYQNLLKKGDGILAPAKTPGEKLLAMRKSAFIAELAHTKIFLARLERGAQLKSGEIKKISGFLDSAARLFEKNTPESFEKAQFILTTAKQYASISLERKAARLDSLEATNIDFYATVEGDPLFRSEGKFDPAKFQRLTGVPYDEFKARTVKLHPGFAKVISHYTTKAVSHYDVSLKHLDSVLALAASEQPADMRKVIALYGMASREQIRGRKEHAQIHQIKPLIAASAEIYKVLGKLPSIRKTESDTSDWRLGPQGKNDLVALRKKVQDEYATTITYIYKASLCLLASQNSKEREGYLKQAKTLLLRAQTANTEFQKSAATFHTHYSYTKEIVANIRRTGTQASEDSAQGESAVGAMHDYLKRLVEDPKFKPRFEALLRSYCVRNITNPNFLATSKWPRGEQLREHIKNYMGWDVYRTFYDGNATPSQLKVAAAKLLDLKVDVEVSVPTGNEKGQIYTKKIVKERLGDHLQKQQKLVPLYNMFKGIKDGKTLSLEKRREMLFEFLKQGSNKTMVGAIGRVESNYEANLKTQFKASFLDHIKSLKKQLADVEKTGKRININGSYILENLRPRDIYFESGISGKTEAKFADPKVVSAYRQLQADAAFVAPIVGNMSEFLADMNSSFRTNARLMLGGVAAFHAYRQKYVELEERKNSFIMAGTIVGTLLAIPFSLGSSGIAAFSIIATGTTLGGAATSVYLAHKEYKMRMSDPNARQWEKDKAYENFRSECILAGLVTVPVLGTVGRTFAASRGALALARMAAGFESVGIVSGYLGAKQFYDGVSQIRKGEAGWGTFNIVFGGLGFASGILGPISSLREAKALNKSNTPISGGAARPESPAAPATPNKPQVQPARDAAGADARPGGEVARPTHPDAPAAPRKQVVQPPREGAGPNPATKPEAPAKPAAQPREEAPGPKARPGGDAIQPKQPAAPAAATPAERIPANITNLEEANIVLRDSKTLSDAQVIQIKAAYDRIEKQSVSGVKLTPQQENAYRDFKRMMNLIPRADAIQLTNFKFEATGNLTTPVTNITSALAARQRLLRVGRVRSLNPAEKNALARFESAVKAQKELDLRALSAFNSKFTNTPYNPSRSEKSIAGLAYERMAMLEKSDLTAAEAAVLSAHRDLLKRFGALKTDLGSPESLTGFVNDLRSGNQGIRDSATVEFNRLPDGVKSEVKALLHHFTANNLWSARHKEQQVAAAKAYSERIKQLPQ